MFLLWHRDVNQVAKRYPATMTNSQRKQIHDIAERLKLDHASQGEGPEKFLVVSKAKLHSPQKVTQPILATLVISLSSPSSFLLCSLTEKGEGKGIAFAFFFSRPARELAQSCGHRGG